MTDKRDFAQQRRGLWGLALCTVVKMEWINMKVQQINGTERSSTLRLEQEGCVGRGCEMKLEKEAGRITAVIWEIYRAPS